MTNIFHPQSSFTKHFKLGLDKNINNNRVLLHATYKPFIFGANPNLFIFCLKSYMDSTLLSLTKLFLLSKCSLEVSNCRESPRHCLVLQYLYLVMPFSKYKRIFKGTEFSVFIILIFYHLCSSRGNIVCLAFFSLSNNKLESNSLIPLERC